MVPYKRHCAKTIEMIVTSGTDSGIIKDASVPCENRTIHRILLWWNVVLPYFMNIIKSLSERLNILYNPTPSLREIVRAIVNSNSWIFANSICTRSVAMSA